MHTEATEAGRLWTSDAYLNMVARVAEILLTFGAKFKARVRIHKFHATILLNTEVFQTIKARGTLNSITIPRDMHPHFRFIFAMPLLARELKTFKKLIVLAQERSQL